MANLPVNKTNEILEARLLKLQKISETMRALQEEFDALLKEGGDVRLSALKLIDELKMSKVKNYIQTK
jgi:hypothetical protein